MYIYLLLRYLKYIYMHYFVLNYFFIYSIIFPSNNKKGDAMRRMRLEKKLLYREHFLTLFVVSLEFTNALMNWM